MRAGSGDLEEHPVIAVVIFKPVDLRKSDPIPVERDQFIKLVGVTSGTQLRWTIIANLPDSTIRWLSPVLDTDSVTSA
jgi:hypothetical protein